MEEKVQNKSNNLMGKVRENPWIIASFVLGILLLGSLIFGSSITGAAISGDQAGENLVKFINAQGSGQATLVSSTREGSFYNVIVNYNGQNVPVYVTLDGKNLVSDLVPLDPNAAANPTVPAGGNVESVELGTSPVLGQETAEVIIVEFSDYECPFCERFYSQTLGQIKTNYVDTGKAKLVYKDFPLSFHAMAEPAAIAARCFAEQGKDYFVYHDKLFENQASLSIENFKKWAKELGANTSQFNTCLDSEKYADEVAADMAYGSQLGVTGTPGFLIGNEEEGYVLVSGAQPFSVFKQVIDNALA